jgi:hypothetical protein
MLHTPSKQSTLPRGAAAQRCIRQVNNQQYSVVQRRDAAYAFVFLLLVLLAPRNVCLSLACPSRSMEIFSFASLSLSLSLAYLCLYAFPSLSLVFVTTGRAALCPFLSLACSTRSKENPYLTCTSCSILVSLSCLSSSLQIAT